MRQEFFDLRISTNGQKLYDFTGDTIKWIKKNNFKNGVLNLIKSSKNLAEPFKRTVSRLYELTSISYI